MRRPRLRPPGFPSPRIAPGALAHPPAGGAPAVQFAPARRSGLRRFVVPVLIVAALVYGGKTAYDWFVEGRFLVSTDDAYVGADTSIIAAKAMGHLTAVPVVDNQIVHKGELLASIDDGDYQNALDAARARIGTQDATIARFARQIDAQGAIIAQAEAQVASAPRRSRAPKRTSSGPGSNTTGRSSSLRPISARSSGSSRRPPTATAPSPRSPPPGRARLRRRRRWRAQRPISTC